jgi:hypothetical protein
MSIGNLAKTLLAHIARYDYTVRMKNPSSPAVGAFRLGDKLLAHNLKQKQGSPALYPVDQVESARFADRDRRMSADLLVRLVPNAQHSPAVTLEQAHPADAPNYKWKVLSTVIFGIFMIILDTTVVNVAFQTLRQDFGGDLKNTQWIISPGVRGALT